MASAPDKDGVTPPPKWLFRLPQSYLGFQPHLRGAQGLHSGHVGLVPPLPQGSAAGECHGQREAPGGPHGGNRSTCSDVKGSGALTCARAPGRRCPAHLGARAQLRHVTPCQPCARLPAGCRRTDPALSLHRSVLPRTLCGWGLLAHDLGCVGHGSPHGESTAEEQPTLSGRCGSRVHPPGSPPQPPEDSRVPPGASITTHRAAGDTGVQGPVWPRVSVSPGTCAGLRSRGPGASACLVRKEAGGLSCRGRAASRPLGWRTVAALLALVVRRRRARLGEARSLGRSLRSSEAGGCPPPFRGLMCLRRLPSSGMSAPVVVRSLIW